MVCEILSMEVLDILVKEFSQNEHYVWKGVMWRNIKIKEVLSQIHTLHVNTCKLVCTEKYALYHNKICKKVKYMVHKVISQAL